MNEMSVVFLLLGAVDGSLTILEGMLESSLNNSRGMCCFWCFLFFGFFHWIFAFLYDYPLHS